MKSIITISVIVFMSLTTTLHAQWLEVDSPTSKDITDIHFADSENGFMSCVLGTVLKTTNGGLDWQAFNTEIRATFMSIFGIDKDTVYTARVSLYKSTNSCVSWADYGGLGSSGSTIFDIHFTSSKTGFIIKSGKLYKTNDYGLNWYEVYNVYPGGNIIFTSQDTGYVVGGGTADCDPVPCNPPINYGAVIKTTDKGESWQKLTFFNDSLNIISASFIDNNFGYCFSSNNTIQKTEDGGLTWISIDTGITGGSITGGLFINKSTGFIITNMGLIYITTNGGINWNLEYTASDGLFEIGGSNKMVVAGGNDGLICVRNLDNFQNWADNNAVWHYNQINFDTPPNQGYIKFTALGDTIIHEDTLKVILEENVSIDDTLSGNIYMKSDSNRVYYYIPEIKAYKLLYDFTAGPGDTLDVYCRQASNDSTIRIHIDSLSTIDVNGISLKVQHVRQIHSETDEFWLEGEIIENIGWTGFMFPLHAWADPPYGGSLRCYQDDEAGLYKLTDTDCDYIAGSQPNAYKILIHEGKLWSNTVIPSMPGEFRSYWIKFEGDTIINGLEYKKAWRAEDSLHSEWHLKEYIREDVANQKVYLYNSYSQEDILLYDFSLEQGDSILTWTGTQYEKVDTVIYEPFGNSADTLKQICFDPGCNTRWIEGIGSVSGILEGRNAFYLVGGTPRLVCYYESNNLVYHNPDFETCFPEGIAVSVSTFDNQKEIVIYPNPARDKITLVSPPEHSIKEIRLYSLTGTCLYRNTNIESNLYELEATRFPEGTYILKVSNGKEVVTKKIVLY